MQVELSPKAINLIRRSLQWYLQQQCADKNVMTVESMIEEFIAIEEQTEKAAPSYYNPQWGHNVPIDAPLYALMTEHGFDTHHTGGGCMSWSKENPNDGSWLMIGTESSLGEWKDRDQECWVVGRYSEDYGGFTEVYQLTLAQAVELAEKLPAPHIEQNSYTFAEFNALSI